MKAAPTVTLLLGSNCPLTYRSTKHDLPTPCISPAGCRCWGKGRAEGPQNTCCGSGDQVGAQRTESPNSTSLMRGMALATASPSLCDTPRSSGFSAEAAYTHESQPMGAGVW